MLFKTFIAFRELVEYSRKKDGSWKAEFRGPLNVIAEAATLERCRWEVQDRFDEALAAWIVTPKPAAKRRSKSA